MIPAAPKVLYMLWTGPDDADGEAETAQEAMEFALHEKELFVTEESAIEIAKEVATERADSGGECAVYRLDLTKIGVATAHEADYDRA